MDLEDILLVLMNKTGKNRHEIMSLIERKQLDSGGTISTKASANLVARDLNVDINEIISSQPNKIKDLLHMAPGSSNIIITGFVNRTYHPINFKHDSEDRLVQNIILSDESGSIRLILWGNMVKVFKEINVKKGSEIRLIKGILKNGRLGERELHLGENSSIELVNESHNNSAFVWQNVLFPSSVSKAHLELREVDIQGIVVRILNVEQENRPSSIYLVDPESTNFENAMRVNFWRERKNEALKFEIGNKILLEGVNIREGMKEQLEINFNRNSNATIISKGNQGYKKLIQEAVPILSPYDTTKKAVDKNIGSLTLNEPFNLIARIFFIGNIVFFKRKDMSEGKVVRIGIFDKFGSIFLVLWDDQTDTVDELKIKDIIYIANCYLRENRGNREINLPKIGNVTKPTENVNFNIPQSLPFILINELSSNWSIASIQGKIILINETRSFTKNDGSEGSVKSLKIADNTGELKVIAWNDTITIFDEIQIDDLISIDFVSIRTNNFGDFEAHIRQNSILKKIEGGSIPEHLNNVKYTHQSISKFSNTPYRRINLSELSDDFKEEISNMVDSAENSRKDVYIEFRASIVEVFDSPLYYNACKSCFKKVELISEDKGLCPNHNETEFTPKLLFRVLLDDGTKIFNATMIGGVAENITGMNSELISDFLKEHENDEFKLYNEIKSKVLGHEYFIKGILGIRRSNDLTTDKIYWDLRIKYMTNANPDSEIEVLEDILENL